MPSYTIFVPHPSNLLTDHLPFGDGLLAWGFLDRLADRGHRLHVACQRVDVAAPERDNLRLYRLTDAPKLRLRRRIRYIARMRRLYATIAARERIDLVHQLNPVDLGVSLGLPRAAPPLVLGPYVPDWPGDSSARTPQPAPAPSPSAHARRAVRAAQQRRAALLLLSSAAAEAKVAHAGVRTAIVPPGIEASEFAGVAAAPAIDRPPTVLFLANLQVRKGVLTLVEAFEEVVASMPEARLLIAGSGPNEEEVRRLVAASPAAPRIELLGKVARPEIAATMAAADVYCLPSHGEPFGISALEAMAAGLPLVTTSAGGLGRLAPPAGGLQAPPRDARALAAALLALLRDPARREAMGRENRATVLRDYDWERVIDRLEGLYAETAARR